MERDKSEGWGRVKEQHLSLPPHHYRGALEQSLNSPDCTSGAAQWPADEPTGCTGQLPGVNVRNCVREEQGFPAKESTTLLLWLNL